MSLRTYGRFALSTNNALETMLSATIRLGRLASNGKFSAPTCGTVCDLSSSAFNKKEREPYTERQAKLNRPVSPHVTIYAFPTVAISSIMNRVTGVALSGTCLSKLPKMFM